MDKISDHPGFKAALPVDIGTPAAMPVADRAGAMMTSMLTGCIVSHAMQHSPRAALDVAVSVLLTASIALEVGEEDFVEILSRMPEIRCKMIEARAMDTGPAAPDPAS